MRDATFYASSLLDLDKVTGAAERRASWRQSMAALASATADEGPGPLEGLNPAALVAGVRAALAAGLADDLDWLAPAAAGAALFELAGALPPGPEQRDLGRRVLARLMAADAATFAVIARRMAMASRAGLLRRAEGRGGAAIRARVALVTELPLSAGVAAGPLALAIAARRELARDWIGEPSTGSLPSRRLAARLLERTAREVARRAAYGDDHALRVFRSDVLAPAWARLLADRESLVWRHVAVARGLLAPWQAGGAAALEAALAPGKSPTEWRRAAASVGALVAVAPDAALAMARKALAAGLLVRDPGAAGALVWGLARGAEAEPAAAGELLEQVVEHAGVDVGEAVVDLRAELGDAPFARRAAALAASRALERTRDADEAGALLAAEVAADLEPARSGEAPVRDGIARALAAFGAHGAREAHALARDALAGAQGTLVALEGLTPAVEAAPTAAGARARARAFAVLRDLDVGLLERDVLAHLLALGGGDAATEAGGALDPLRDRLAEWILAREGAPDADAADAAAPGFAARRLRTLVHLVDCDLGRGEGDAARAAALRERWLRTGHALLGRLGRGPRPALRRTVLAALARTLDALVRTEACDEVDVLLFVASVGDARDLETLGEAAMGPDLVHVVSTYAAFARAAVASPAGALDAFDRMAAEIAPESSGRIDSLRTVLGRIGAALRALAGATSLADLGIAGSGEVEPLATLEQALAALRSLGAAAQTRLGGEPGEASPPTQPGDGAGVSRGPYGSGAALAARLQSLAVGLPVAVALLVAEVARGVAALPAESALSVRPSLRTTEGLPSWIPPARTLGGFYVHRSLAAGGGGSVFVATRIEERSDAGAERLALKVPEFSATEARSMSEAQFLEMFRAEASALLALPRHRNLARFVTFDSGTKPKPILVMELVEGPTLEGVVRGRQLDVPRALGVLDDVLAGLEAMHAAGLAHLDVKPSNVVLRGGREGVLVDFGLAGRHLRPGCATGPYGAPEVWGALDGVASGGPAQADVYAFGCVTFEALTGRVLFDAPNDVAQVAMHVSHDGFPPGMRALATDGRLGPLSELLFATLRRNPNDRITAGRARQELARLRPALERVAWPVDAAGKGA